MKKIADNPYLKRKPLPKQKIFSTRAGVIKQDPPVMLIQGMTAGSKEEWYVAQALNKMHLSYTYQKSIRGGRKRAGGQILDYLVATPGKQTVVDVRGTYWHTGRHEDSLSLMVALQKYDYNLVVIWDTEATSVSAALSFLRDRLPLG